MDIAALAAELAKSDYAGKTTAQKFAALTTPSVTVPKPGTRLAELGVLDVLGPTAGEAFLQGLEAAAQSNPTLARIVRWLRTDYGVDLGNATLQQQLLGLAQLGVVTQQSAEALVAHGSKQISIAEQNGWHGLGLGHVKSAEEFNGAA